MTKICTACGIEKPESDFGLTRNRVGREYRRGRCRECQNAYLKNWYAANRARHIQAVLERRATKKTKLTHYPEYIC